MYVRDSLEREGMGETGQAMGDSQGLVRKECEDLRTFFHQCIHIINQKQSSLPTDADQHINTQPCVAKLVGGQQHLRVSNNVIDLNCLALAYPNTKRENTFDLVEVRFFRCEIRHTKSSFGRDLVFFLKFKHC